MFLKKVLKFIYLYLFPNYLKLVLFSLIKKHVSLNDKIKKHLTFKGFFKLKYNGKSIYVYSLPTIIESDIFWNGIENSKHEPMCYKIFYYFASKSKYIIDGGSNTGIYSCIAHLSNKEAEIHSFEPSKEFVYVLNKIKKKNKISLFINQVALGNSNREVYFDGLYKISLDKSEKKSIPTKMIKLSEYISLNLKKLDLIKLDIEGFELDVLKDIRSIISKDLPTIIFEMWNDELKYSKNKENFINLENLIKNLNYKIYCIDDINEKIINKKSITPSKILESYTTASGEPLIFENYLLVNDKYNKDFINNFKKYL